MSRPTKCDWLLGGSKSGSPFRYPRIFSLKVVSACRLMCLVCEMVRGSLLIPNEPNHVKKAANSTAELAENRMPLHRVHGPDLRCRGPG